MWQGSWVRLGPSLGTNIAAAAALDGDMAEVIGS